MKIKKKATFVSRKRVSESNEYTVAYQDGTETKYAAVTAENENDAVETLKKVKNVNDASVAVRDLNESLDFNGVSLKRIADLSSKDFFEIHDSMKKMIDAAGLAGKVEVDGLNGVYLIGSPEDIQKVLAVKNNA